MHVVVLKVLPWGAGSQVGARCGGPRHVGILQNGVTNPPPRASDMKGTRRIGPRYLSSQRLGKLFGSVDLVREVLAGALLNNGHVIS